MNSEYTSNNFQEEGIVTNKKRGDILSYSVSQVAALLGQEDSNILLFTNIFDNILKIEISDKELTYTNRDIDKLEFLINLKNKGLTTKEIQKYFESLPLDIEDIIGSKDHSSTSGNEIIETIVKSENEQFDNLKEYLTNEMDKNNELGVEKLIKSENEQFVNLKEYITNKIDENNELIIEKIIKSVTEEQNKQLKLFKDDILNEVKEFINSKFDIESKANEDLYNKISTKVDDLSSEKLSLEDNINLQMDKFTELSISRDKNLIDEIKKYANIMDQAYHIQNEMDTSKEKTGFLSRIFLDNN